MTNWDYAVNRTLMTEGGYCNVPGDPGGETKYGITKRDYPNEDIANLTLAHAHAIYRRDYWDRLGLDDVTNRYAAAEVFDTAVNCGVGKAAQIAQRACRYLGEHITVDGVMGPATRGALNRLAQRNTFALVMALNMMQGIWYATIEEKNPQAFEQFSAGWMQRLRVPAELIS